MASMYRNNVRYSGAQTSAKSIYYNSENTNLIASNVQDAITELQNRLDKVLDATVENDYLVFGDTVMTYNPVDEMISI